FPLDCEMIDVDMHRFHNFRCEEIMTALEDCHARGFMWKAIGMCSSLKEDVNKCLRAERLARTAENRERAKEKKAKIQAVWAEIDANS
ncbi:hypothetical protein B0A48_13882, partial [Cryoendolithus antarcticus]